MSILTISKSNNATNVIFDDLKLYIFLEDGRELSVPLDWFPVLRDANKNQKEKWLFIGDGEGIHWEDQDEEILVEGLL